MLNKIRTDLAMEAREIWQENSGSAEALPGVKAEEKIIGSFRLTRVEILDTAGEQALCKPIGKYSTLELDGLLRREENAFMEAADILAAEIRRVLPLMPDAGILVAGLGNPDITPDAIGPESLRSVMVTRHLKEYLPKDFADFRTVSAVEPGVLATTGLESADMIAAVGEKIKPDAIIAVDALASRQTDRLCRTVQISDTGITPGSGVGNSRAELSRRTLGVPVLAVGVPTVVDAATLTAELAAKAGTQLPDDSNFGDQGNMIVTPRDIDQSVKDISKLIGYAINLALHDGLTLGDIDMFLS